MTKLIFVHGINNQGKNSTQIKDEWSDALNSTLKSNGLSEVPQDNIEAAYYGDLLHEMSRDRSGDSDQEELEKFADTLNNDFVLYENDDTGELSYLVSQSDEFILSGADQKLADGERDIFRGDLGKRAGHTKIAISTAHLINGLFPGLSPAILRLLMKQAGSYLKYKDIYDKVNNKVEEQIFKGMDQDSIIVSHSLGTIVSYNLLRAGLGQGNVRALYTIGSPLGIDFILDELKSMSGELAFPQGLPKWYNCWDQADFVAFNKPIDQSTLGVAGITNINTFDTSKKDKHAIDSYLRHEFLARLIYSDLNL